MDHGHETRDVPELQRRRRHARVPDSPHKGRAGVQVPSVPSMQHLHGHTGSGTCDSDWRAEDDNPTAHGQEAEEVIEPSQVLLGPHLAGAFANTANIRGSAPWV